MYEHFWHSKTPNTDRLSVWFKKYNFYIWDVLDRTPFQASLFFGYVQSGPERTCFSGSTVCNCTGIQPYSHPATQLYSWAIQLYSCTALQLAIQPWSNTATQLYSYTAYIRNKCHKLPLSFLSKSQRLGAVLDATVCTTGCGPCASASGELHPDLSKRLLLKYIWNTVAPSSAGRQCVLLWADGDRWWLLWVLCRIVFYTRIHTRPFP